MIQYSKWLIALLATGFVGLHANLAHAFPETGW